MKMICPQREECGTPCGDAEPHVKTKYCEVGCQYMKDSKPCVPFVDDKEAQLAALRARITELEGALKEAKEMTTAVRIDKERVKRELADTRGFRDQYRQWFLEVCDQRDKAEAARQELLKELNELKAKTR